MLVVTRMAGDSVTRGPRPKNAVPEWALALKMRRLQLGGLTQEDVQARSGDAISQGTISDLERGKVALDSLNIKRAAALARALNWSLSELQTATGTDLGLDASELEAQERRQSSTPIPDTLAQAAEIYGKRFPELLEPRWQHYLASFRPRYAKEAEPEVWLDLYRDLSKHGITPGGH